MVRRIPVHLLDPASGTDGQVPVISGGKFVIGDSGSSRNLPVIDVVTDFGAAVDGTTSETDDTDAWNNALAAAGDEGGARIISSRPGVSIIDGPLLDTSGANAQLLMPAVDAVDSENISITIEGAFPPGADMSVIGTTPLPVGHLVLKSTLTSGSGGALLGAKGPPATAEELTNVDLTLRNVAFRMPANPTHTALDLRRLVNIDLERVVVDAGSYFVQGLTEPSTSGSYAIRTPKLNNGAHTRLNGVDVIGFYNGYEFGEHSLGSQLNAWGCKVAFGFIAAYHASKFQRLMAVHCERVLKFTGGAHYVDIDQLNIEHAAAGWWVTDYDIDDASNYGHGKVKWHVVLAGVGIDSTFTVNGASNMSASRVGTEPTAPSLTVQDEGVGVDTAVTEIDFQGDGVTVTDDGTGRVEVTIPGATSSAARWEVVMTSGTSSPPVPVETPDGTDWVYAEVED